MNTEHNIATQTQVLDDILDDINPLDQQKTEERMLVAARIEDLVQEKHLTKRDFAALVDQVPSVVTKWLSGTHNFTIDTLTEISYALGVPLSELFYDRSPVMSHTSV